MWPVVPSSVRLPEKQRHYSDAALGSFRRPHKVGLADRQLHLQQGTKRTLAPRHESHTTKILSGSLAATGLEAAFAACHYPFSPIRLRPIPG